MQMNKIKLSKAKLTRTIKQKKYKTRRGPKHGLRNFLIVCLNDLLAFDFILALNEVAAMMPSFCFRVHSQAS